MQGARIRHRMRRPACQGLCREILEMDHMVLPLSHALSHNQTAADAELQRQLKQHLRVRR